MVSLQAWQLSGLLKNHNETEMDTELIYLDDAFDELAPSFEEIVW